MLRRPLLIARKHLTAKSQLNCISVLSSRNWFSSQASTVPELKENPIPKVVENVSARKHEFQAETRQLLNIVTNSIYTDKDVFIRELISNASDSLEKLRHLQATGEKVYDPELPLEIRITTDAASNTIVIEDTGIGMNHQELVDNLGTIARSGSKAFLENLKEQNESSSASSGIIGKFGVGFYSAFMTADNVNVFTRSAIRDDKSYCWSSDGTGSYEIADAENVTRGSKIVLHLKEDCKDFAKSSNVKDIIKRYSNFVSFPIYLDGEEVNTVQAIWTMNKNEISEEQYKEFFKYITNSFDEPQYRLQFKTDAPLDLKTLFFIGSYHTEKNSMARLTPGVSLYSRKVLIEKNSNDILPPWMRFIQGVVDSEDLPLSLSRESMQDSRLLFKIKSVLTRKILRFLEEESKKDIEKFNLFFLEFGQFIKEGICSDFENKDDIAKLLRFESSALDSGSITSLDEYVSRSSPSQDKIYYLQAPTRELAESSPYYETFKKSGTEVLFLYNPIDDFVMANVEKFNGRKLVSAEVSDIDMEKKQEEEKKDDDNIKGNLQTLPIEDQEDFKQFIKLVLESSVGEVKLTNRLDKSPAIVTDHESASVRRVMTMLNSQKGIATQKSLHVLEINPNHPIIALLNQLRKINKEMAEMITLQVYDNALIAAGLLDDGRSMLPRLNSLLEQVLKKNVTN